MTSPNQFPEGDFELQPPQLTDPRGAVGWGVPREERGYFGPEVVLRRKPEAEPDYPGDRYPVSQPLDVVASPDGLPPMPGHEPTAHLSVAEPASSASEVANSKPGLRERIKNARGRTVLKVAGVALAATGVLFAVESGLESQVSAEKSQMQTVVNQNGGHMDPIKATQLSNEQTQVSGWLEFGAASTKGATDALGVIDGLLVMSATRRGLRAHAANKKARKAEEAKNPPQEKLNRRQRRARDKMVAAGYSVTKNTVAEPADAPEA